MTVSNCDFYKNEATKGGVIYITEISTNTYKSSLSITGSTFYNS